MTAPTVSEDLLFVARDWIDAQVIGRIPADERSDEWVVRAVEVFYPGGWPAFTAVVSACVDVRV